MATGVETAGLVLSSIPLILASLELYSNGIAVSKRYWRYQEEFNSLMVELSTEHTMCVNSINMLLIGITNQEEIVELLANPCGGCWKEEKFDRRLKRRLGTTYESYVETITQLDKTAKVFQQRLKLDDTGRPQFTEAKAFKQHYKRLKFSLNKSDYNDLMTKLQQTNSSLHRMTTQTISLESLQSSNKLDRQTIPNFSVIDDKAQGFHSALRSSWKCSCHADHSVSLRLESRMEDVSSDDDDDDEHSIRDPFRVVFCYSQQHTNRLSAPKKAIPPWTWEEADVRLILKSQDSTAVTPATTGGKRTRFASQAKKAVKSALDPHPNLQPIQDLCTAISTLQKPQRDVCLSPLASEYAKRKYGILIYPLKEPPTDTDSWSVSSLRNVLKEPTFARRDRLQLSVTLASSVLQLHETPWIIRNQTLYALGISLIELWYGKALSELHKPEDGPPTTGDPSIDRMTEWHTADRHVDELYNEAGAKYSDAVRRCIRCDFDRRASSLDDTAFQKAVYQGVLAQLKENFDFTWATL